MGTSFDPPVVFQVRTFGVNLPNFTPRSSWILGDYQDAVSGSGVLCFNLPRRSEYYSQPALNGLAALQPVTAEQLFGTLGWLQSSSEGKNPHTYPAWLLGWNMSVDMVV